MHLKNKGLISHFPGNTTLHMEMPERLWVLQLHIHLRSGNFHNPLYQRVRIPSSLLAYKGILNMPFGFTPFSLFNFVSSHDTVCSSTVQCIPCTSKQETFNYINCFEFNHSVYLPTLMDRHQVSPVKQGMNALELSFLQYYSSPLGTILVLLLKI